MLKTKCSLYNVSTAFISDAHGNGRLSKITKHCFVLLWVSHSIRINGWDRSLAFMPLQKSPTLVTDCWWKCTKREYQLFYASIFLFHCTNTALRDKNVNIAQNKELYLLVVHLYLGTLKNANEVIQEVQ